MLWIEAESRAMNELRFGSKAYCSMGLISNLRPRPGVNLEQRLHRKVTIYLITPLR